MSTQERAALTVALFSFIAAMVCIAAWLTHCIWIIKALASAAGATAGQIVLGLMGTFIPPIGVIHGIMIWFGF